MEKSSSAASKNPHLETKDKSKEMSLYDLCDPAYTLKWKKTNKRKKSDEFTSAVKKKDDKRLLASSAPRPTVNSSVSKSSANVSSSSSGGNRGGGPRVEIINGKVCSPKHIYTPVSLMILCNAIYCQIVVKESSLVLQFNQMAEDEYEEVVEGSSGFTSVVPLYVLLADELSCFRGALVGNVFIISKEKVFSTMG